MSAASKINLLNNAFQVNTSEGGTQSEISLTALKNGGFVAVWVNAGSDAPGSISISAQIYGKSGTPIGSEFQINGQLAADSLTDLSPTVSAQNNGGFVVTWQSRTAPGLGQESGIYARTFKADGTPRSDEFQVPTQTNPPSFAHNFQKFPDMTVLEDGSFVVVWLSGHALSGDLVYSQRYAANGTPQGGIQQVPALSVATTSPAVSALSDGGYVVSWQTFSPDNSQGIAMRRFDKSGTPVSGEINVNTTTDGDQTDSQIIGLENGGWVVIWSSTHGSAPYYGETTGQVYTKTGVPAGDEFSFITEGTFGSSGPTVTALKGGGFIVATGMANPDAPGPADIYARVFNNNGVQQGDVQAVLAGASEITGAQVNPEITTLSDGRLVVAWENFTEGSLSAKLLGSGFATKGDNALFADDTGGILRGLAGDDVLTGGSNIDTLFGGKGDDILKGMLNQDTLKGDIGNDRLFGGGGRDRLEGGAGEDTLSGDSGNDRLFGGKGKDVLSGGDGNDVVQGQAGNDTLTGGKGNDALNGGSGRDKLSGGAGVDNLIGGNANDRLLGENGSDNLYGGAGNDIIKGGKGLDWIEGGTGNDKMSGGSGADTFVFNDSPNSGETDVITDFVSGEDILDLSGVLDGAGVTGQVVSGLSGTAGDIVLGADGLVSIDLIGDGTADLRIRVEFNGLGVQVHEGDLDLIV